MPPSCPFCPPSPDRTLHDGALTAIVLDASPVSPGHALVITKRHVASFFDATDEEQAELLRGVALARDLIQRTHAPDGFNVGVNIGAAAGQTVMHLHVHVIPRYSGDVEDPRGGVRHVIPAKGNYLLGAAASDREPPERGTTPRGAVVCGPDEPLLRHLVRDLEHATQADIAVAFTLRSGLDHLEPHLRDLLTRSGGRLRFLTGDYLDVTDPVALRRLLDLTSDPSLGARAEVRVFETARAGTSFHPKAYLLHGSARSVAYVGSSNLSRQALTLGVEWNYRAESGADETGVRAAFDALFLHAASRPLDAAWIDAYEARRRPPAQGTTPIAVDQEAELPPEPPTPHLIQEEALAALARTRAEGFTAGLVVLATGLGKTWLSAFDSAGARRVLFVAHREEILGQAMATFRRIRPQAHLGWFTGKEKDDQADVVFASVQTLGKPDHTARFDRDAFDYIVIDEFHHAAAATYRRILDHFDPEFLLGLTATPERTDGGDLLALCQQNLVYRCDVLRGIQEALLAPFSYFGVPDDVDYAQIPWRSSRFDEDALTNAVATRRRADNALEQFRKHRGRRAFGYCVSQRHADFMAEHFRDAGVRAAAVHAGPTSAPRATALENLAAEENTLDIIFAVDMFNEGVDVPGIDTVLMLRPTESRIVWLQQFGRGLRRAEGKDRLTVVDYIGNHRSFLMKPQALLGLGPGHLELQRALDALQANRLDLPPGCEVTYELEAVSIIESLLRIPRKDRGKDALRVWYELFREQRGERPRAVQAFEERYDPRSGGDWLEFVRGMGDLTDDERAAVSIGRAFLSALEKTSMTRSYKMVLLLAMLGEGALPGSIGLDALTLAVARIARRSPVLARDISVDPTDPAKLRSLLVKNPIDAWTGPKAGEGGPFFTYDPGAERFATAFDIPDPATREAFQELARELVDWRLAKYLDANVAKSSERPILKVLQAKHRPIVDLDRERHPELPAESISLLIEGRSFEGSIAHDHLSDVKRNGRGPNQLPAILRRWFGADAGERGTRYMVACEGGPDGRYVLTPVDPRQPSPELWRRYAREQIPAMWGFEYNRSPWQTGFVHKHGHIFLLVTLEKESMREEHRFGDRFLSPHVFEWQSQNRQRQDTKGGQRLRHHKEQGIDVHLFVREKGKTTKGASPFVYCGELDFLSWEGEQPITVRWRLRAPLPGVLQTEWGIADGSPKAY